MNENLIRRLVQLVDESNVHEIEFSRWGKKIRITKNPPINAREMVYHTPSSIAAPVAAQPQAPVSAPQAAAAPASAPEAAAPAGNILKSPIVGTFYRSPAPDEPAFVKVGDTVSKGQTLCIIEAMKIMNEIESEHQGIVREILIENGEPVEFGTPLIRIE